MANGLTKTDAKVKNFLKIETTTKFTDPRNISPRSDEFLAILGPYISAFEHAALKAPFLIKGNSLSARDHKMRPLLLHNRFIEIDFSRFDMTVNFDLLRDVQDSCFLAAFPQSAHPLFAEALRLARTTKGISEFGTSYFIRGTRCSGDAHTSIGNGLINRFAIWWCLSSLPAGSWTGFHEGDDVIIGIDEQWLDVALDCLKFLSCLGLVPKIDIHPDVHFTSFCGRFLSHLSSGLVSICDPLRSLAKFHTTVSSGEEKALMLAKALSYYHTDWQTPVVGTLCFSLITVLRPLVNPRRLRRALAFNKRNMPWFMINSDMTAEDLLTMKVTKPPSENPLRYLFTLRTGITSAYQIALEREYLTWTHTGVPSSIPPIPIDWTLRDHQYISGRVRNYN